MASLLNAIATIQVRQHTVSIRELEQACGISRQAVCNWLKQAEKRGLVNRHNGRRRGVELLPKGRYLMLGMVPRKGNHHDKRA